MLVIAALIMRIFTGDGGFIIGSILLAVAVLLFVISGVATRIILKYALNTMGLTPVTRGEGPKLAGEPTKHPSNH